MSNPRSGRTGGRTGGRTSAEDRRKRSTARMHAVQAVYQLELNEGRVADVVAEYLDHRLGQDIDGEELLPADRDFFQDLVLGTADRRLELDSIVERSLSLDYTMDRLETLLRALLRVAAYEMLARVDVPAKVVINEYVDLGVAFFAGGETGLVNGVLDRMAREIRPGEIGDQARR